jgi:mannose-6-phosphate isomerase-like protein (cupin superfamily)
MDHQSLGPGIWEQERTMQKALPGMLAVLLVLSPAPAFAQAARSASSATDILATQIQAALKKAIQDLRPGVTVSDQLIGLPDMGKYNVGVAVIARPAGTFQSYLSHDKITEMYYILRGSGTQVTGTMIDGKRGAAVSLTIGPSLSSTSPLQNSHSSKLGPGDVQIIPPGVGHGWSSIDPGGIEYLTFRVDPDHVLALR